MWKSIRVVPAVLALVGCSNSKRPSDAGKLIEARDYEALDQAVLDHLMGLK